MRVLAPVVEVAALTMFHSGQELAFGGTVALELIRDDHPWHVLQAFEQLAKELLRSLFVPPTLHQDIEDVVVLIYRAPPVMAFAMDRQEYLVQVPLVARSRSAATQPIGVVLPKLPTPLTDGLMGHGDATLEQEFLHVAVAEGEPIVEPDPMADDLPRKAVVLVAFGVGRRGHAWLPIHRFL